MWDEPKSEKVDGGGAEPGFGEYRGDTTRGGRGVFECKEIRGKEGIGGRGHRAVSRETLELQ